LTYIFISTLAAYLANLVVKLIFQVVLKYL
jgi:hypothetical protein